MWCADSLDLRRESDLVPLVVFVVIDLPSRTRGCFCGCVGIAISGLVYWCWCLGIGVLRLVLDVRVWLGRKAVQVSGNSDLIYLLSHE
jgi:hypothetical protein